ncbi:MAG: reductive dehalogenase [Candidatus Heimdallarchaeota archaeon]|nr:MAG: reductive dehalogenase [Candidatus Gerdarchaeota archaeon]
MPNKSQQQKKQKFSVSPDFTLNEEFEPFNEHYNVFGRIMWDKEYMNYHKFMYDKVPLIISDGIPGYREIDHALAIASWTVHDYFRSAFSWEKLNKPANVMKIPEPKQYPIDESNIQEVTQYVKAIAKLFGASLVGITAFDPRWVYTEDRVGTPIELPEGLTNVIAIAIEMDADAISTSPSMTQGFANGLGYSNMAALVASLAEFIRKLGYQAIPSGNDTALSIPIAIQAGLGQLGRNGLLVTRQFGSRVRLCKVFTDMPLLHDEPVDFGLTDYCRRCKRCAEACEVDAISFDEEPSFKSYPPSQNKGILRWTIKADLCYQFWVDNGGECSTCITSCPFNMRTAQRYLEPEKFWEKKLEDKE